MHACVFLCVHVCTCGACVCACTCVCVCVCVHKNAMIVMTGIKFHDIIDMDVLLYVVISIIHII